MAWLSTQCIALMVTAPILHVRASPARLYRKKFGSLPSPAHFIPLIPKSSRR